MPSAIYTDITRWIKKVSEVHEKLGNHSMWPFAKNARYHIIQASALDGDPVLIRKEVCIFIMPDKITKSRLQNYCKKISKKYPEYIFLPDHKKANTKMGGMSTGNGKYNLVLAQKRKSLTMARQSLQKNTSYYDNLSKKYKKELWSF